MASKGEREEKLRWWIDFIQMNLDGLSEKERVHVEIDFISYAPWQRQGGYSLDMLRAAQSIMREKLKEALGPGAIRGIFLPPLRRQLTLSPDGKRFQIGTVQFVSVADKISLSKRTPERDWLENELVRLLEGIPRDSIKLCAECKRLFLHLSAKSKKYCSSRCAYRFLSRKKREELRKHPRKYKAYLKQQRELMKRKYDEKIKRQHPKAKIGRKEV